MMITEKGGQIIDRANRDIDGYLARTRGINTHVTNFYCIFCKSQRPTASINRNGRIPHYHCFKCGAYCSTVDLIQRDYNLTDWTETFKKVCELYDTDHGRPAMGRTDSQDFQTFDVPRREYEIKTPTADFTAAAMAAHAELLRNPAALRHYTDRGLTIKTIRTYKLGFSPKGHNALLQAVEGGSEMECKRYKQYLYRFVIPYWERQGKCNYIMTEIADRAKIDQYNNKYNFLKGVTKPIYNERYLTAEKPPKTIFICEGVYDSLSVEQADGRAIALGGVGTNRLEALAKKNRDALKDTTFIICLDADTAGQGGAESAAKALEGLGLRHTERPTPRGKDCNELLQADGTAFEKFIKECKEWT